MFRFALAAAMAVSSAASVGLDCKSTLESMYGLRTAEVAARCRAAFSPGVCAAARQSLGAQPWSSERVVQTCSGFAAAVGADATTLDRALEEKTKQPTTVEQSTDAKTTAPPPKPTPTPASTSSAQTTEEEPEAEGSTGGPEAENSTDSEDQSTEEPRVLLDGEEEDEGRAAETKSSEANETAETNASVEDVTGTEEEANESEEEANQTPEAVKLYSQYGGKPLGQDGSFSPAAGAAFSFVCFVGAAWVANRRRAAVGSDEADLLYSGSVE